ncbi:MAG TPA: metallophosphoesterase family protein [Ideonella sp.]|uniref:metallophosphoesterase family protein n=1 Tax=Ideonella sp. TaxID=1929293 RepID=UPI002B6D2855|nr:metallophosphoesterase family protein [Ideonella sp.]HSI52126.1 metallophosphoesterase family protein [Ideonella sp.]
MSRIAFVSDIHGNLPALEAVAAQIAAAGIHAVVNLGDIASGPLWPRETVRLLMQRDWPTIAGNHERQVLTLPRERMGASDAFAAAQLGEPERAWLAALPPSRWCGEQVFCCHGTPTDDLQYLLETVVPGFDPADPAPRRSVTLGLRAASAAELQVRLAGLVHQPLQPTLLACGHSHVQRIAAQGHTLLLNPGSVGLQAYDDVHPHPHWVETGHPQACWALAEHGPAGWQLALMATPYDFEAAARRADENGRGDWADALRTGRVGRLEPA